MTTNNHKVDIVVGVRDLASGPLQSIARQVGNMSQNFNGMGTSIGAFNRNLDTAIKSLDKMANSMYRFNMYTAGIQRNLKLIGTIGGLGAAGLAVNSANSALEYEYISAKMQSRMGVNADVRKQIDDYILNELNLQVSFTPTEIADLGVVLGQAGIKNPEDMKSLLKTTTFFSEAVDSDVQTAGEMIVAAAKGFDISFQDVSQITDKLTFALNSSLLHVEEMPHMLGQVAGRAKIYGQDLDSTLIAIMNARDQGMSAAQASQNLLHGLQQLSLGGNLEMLWPKRRSYFESLGIDDSFFDLEKKKLKEFPELIEAFEDSMIRQGYMPSREEMARLIEQNNGRMPDDLFETMTTAPLMARVLGKAGMTPIVMGLQARYEELDPETGEKTGNVYYGSEALKILHQQIKNSTGEVEKAHNILAETGKFNLEVLGGAWEAAQIKFANNAVPLIKTGAQELTAMLGGDIGEILDRIGFGGDKKIYGSQQGPLDYDSFMNQKTGWDRWYEAIDETEARFAENGAEGLGRAVAATARFLTDTLRVSNTIIPIVGQIGSAFNEHIVGGNWDGPLIWQPVNFIKNLSSMAMEVLSENENFQKMMENLPKELQDPAKLIAGIVKGGTVLLLTGAIVKVIELAIRGINIGLLSAKLAAKLTDWILRAIGMATVADKIPGTGKNGPLRNVGTMSVNARVVNVYGASINDMAEKGGKGGKNGKGVKNIPIGGSKIPKSIRGLAGPLALFGIGIPAILDYKAQNDKREILNQGDPDGLLKEQMLYGSNGKLNTGSVEAQIKAYNPDIDKPTSSNNLDNPRLAASLKGKEFGEQLDNWIKEFFKGLMPSNNSIQNNAKESLKIYEERQKLLNSLQNPFIMTNNPIFNKFIESNKLKHESAPETKILSETVTAINKLPESISTVITEGQNKVNEQNKEFVDISSEISQNLALNASTMEEFLTVLPTHLTEAMDGLLTMLSDMMSVEFGEINALLADSQNNMIDILSSGIGDMEASVIADLTSQIDTGLSSINSNLTDIISSGVNSLTSAIVAGFGEVNQRLQNIKLNNHINISFQPNISISGQIRERMENIRINSDNVYSTITRQAAIEARRYQR